MTDHGASISGSSKGSYSLRPKAIHSSTKRASLTDEIGTSASTKNVVVLGGSYGGLHAASVLAQRLPPSHRVILIERNSHFNHLYVFPRFSTLPGHEHKAFIPYHSIFKDAPKRPVKSSTSTASNSRDGSRSGDLPSNAPKAASFRYSENKRDTEEDRLGMGSIKPQENLRPATSTGSDSSDGSRGSFRSRQRKSSSGSRSSSGGDDSLYEKGSSRSANTTATSLASSYAEPSIEKQRLKLEEKQIAAGQDAGNRVVEQAIAAEAQSSMTREEEALGRPEIQVESLEGALEKGVDLEGADDSLDGQVATGFEQSSPHVVLQATVTSLTPTHIVVQSNEAAAAAEKTSGKKKLWSIDSVSIPYSHMIYALGSHLPDPLRTAARTKGEGISWMRDIQTRVKNSQEIVLVGGGALGVEFSADIKSVYPDKKVILIHSRKQLLPNFDVKVHEVALKRLQELGVDVVLGERLALTEGCPRGSSVTEQQSNTSQQANVCMPGDAKGEDNSWQAD